MAQQQQQQETKQRVYLCPKDRVVNKIIELFRRKGNDKYMIGEPLTQEEHALQSYMCMKQHEGDKFQRVAALLHDVGHLIKKEVVDPLVTPVDDCHEFYGAKYLMYNGFSPEVWMPVMLHVDAKRYLCSTQVDYLVKLSKASKRTYELQGGAMTFSECIQFQKNPFSKTAILLRRCDDEGKDVDLKKTSGLTLESLRKEIIETLL